MDYRTALVTGASSGIGRELARRLGASGVEVALLARREGLLEEVAAEIRAAGGKARVLAVDVRDLGATTEAIRRVDEEVSGLDLVVASAGVSCIRWAGKLRRSDWEPAIAVNVTGAAATLLAIVDRMVERGRGQLVGVSSLAQYRSHAKYAVYAGTKAFLSTFLEGLRVDLCRSGVVVTDVRPGFVRTPLLEGAPKRRFELTVERAAELILRGVRQGREVVELPWQMAALARSSTLIPARAYAAMLSRKPRRR